MRKAVDPAGSLPLHWYSNSGISALFPRPLTHNRRYLTARRIPYICHAFRYPLTAFPAGRIFYSSAPGQSGRSFLGLRISGGCGSQRSFRSSRSLTGG